MSERDRIWTEDDCFEAGIWDTDCGEKFEFTVDGPLENGMKFCCYCGGKLLISAPDPEETEEEAP